MHLPDLADVLFGRLTADRLVASHAPTRPLTEGLVPAMLGLYVEDEQSLVWERALPDVGTRIIWPLLVCPSDMDLSCTVVVAEVAATDQSVRWLRVGFDRTDWSPSLPNDVGSKVEWIDEPGPFEFDRTEYERMLAAFREEYGEAPA